MWSLIYKVNWEVSKRRLIPKRKPGYLSLSSPRQQPLSYHTIRSSASDAFLRPTPGALEPESILCVLGFLREARVEEADDSTSVHFVYLTPSTPKPIEERLLY